MKHRQRCSIFETVPVFACIRTPSAAVDWGRPSSTAYYRRRRRQCAVDDSCLP